MAFEAIPGLPDLQFRASRLLSGDFRIDDVASLFLGLREHASGLVSVKEIGDLHAHRYNRNKGRLQEVAQESFDALVCVAHSQMDPDGPLPPRYWEAIKALRRRLKPQQLMADTGLPYKFAKSLLRDAENQHGHLQDGGSLRAALTIGQNRLIDYLINTGSTKIALTDDELIRELNTALTRFRISTRPLAGNAATFVILFALAQLHNTLLEMKDGAPAVVVFIHPESGADKLIAHLQMPNPIIDVRRNVIAFTGDRIMSPHFETSLSVDRHIDLATIASPENKSYYLEPTKDLRLVPLN